MFGSRIVRALVPSRVSADHILRSIAGADIRLGASRGFFVQSDALLLPSCRQSCRPSRHATHAAAQRLALEGGCVPEVRCCSEIAFVLLVAWLLGIFGLYRLGDLVHLLFLVSGLFFLLAVAKARDVPQPVSDPMSTLTNHDAHRVPSGPL